ncbi:MAG: cyclic nucleotide-binding domain-containing protein [Desulfobacterales bacterium]|nr:cyclic nucleotide-binding domain-containing protein [Desulfobacterales bacterium]
MSEPKQIIIEVIEENKCPFYQLGDEFRLSGKSLILPQDKPACMTLVEDIRDVRALCESLDDSQAEKDFGHIFNCSGPGTDCPGIVSLEYKKEIITEEQDDGEIEAITAILSSFPIFQTISRDNIKYLVSFLKLKKFPADAYVMQKGEPGVKLYIIISGRVEVLAGDEINIAFLEKGEVFGEMSLLSGEPAVATVKTAEPTRVLFINGKDFRRLLNKFPSLQMYFARLLARRLAETNVARTEDFSSGMIGNLSEMPPADIFQTMNQNQKTGILTLNLPEGRAEFYFREGGFTGAKYGEKKDKEAFFEILKKKEGRFKFISGLSQEQMKADELGDFMWLLMEGLNRIDEGIG